MKSQPKITHIAWLVAAMASGLMLSGCNSSSDNTASNAPSDVSLIAGDYELNTNLGKPVTFVSHDGTVSPAAPFQMTIGYGSEAFHNPKDPADIFYTASDRGPNIKCEDSAKAPVNLADFCGALDSTGTFQVDNNGKIFPAPFFDPTIYQFKLV